MCYTAKTQNDGIINIYVSLTFVKCLIYFKLCNIKTKILKVKIENPLIAMSINKWVKLSAVIKKTINITILLR